MAYVECQLSLTFPECIPYNIVLSCRSVAVKLPMRYQFTLQDKQTNIKKYKEKKERDILDNRAITEAAKYPRQFSLLLCFLYVFFNVFYMFFMHFFPWQRVSGDDDC